MFFELFFRYPSRRRITRSMRVTHPRCVHLFCEKIMRRHIGCRFSTKLKQETSTERRCSKGINTDDKYLLYIRVFVIYDICYEGCFVAYKTMRSYNFVCEKTPFRHSNTHYCVTRAIFFCFPQLLDCGTFGIYVMRVCFCGLRICKYFHYFCVVIYASVRLLFEFLILCILN